MLHVFSIGALVEMLAHLEITVTVRMKASPRVAKRYRKTHWSHSVRRTASTQSGNRLAYVVDQLCVLRYDNEAGKGDHPHRGNAERAYHFTTPEKMIADIQADIERWKSENRHA
ncbi:MAG: DUF6516 family protein [Gemmatimonadota bacterium]